MQRSNGSNSASRAKLPSQRTWLLLVVLVCLAMVLLFVAPARAGTLTVTTTADSGPGSLRHAITSAAPDDTIDFALTYPATIILTSGELAITESLTITGPGPDLLTVSGNDASRVFWIDGPEESQKITVTISDLVIRAGRADLGGGLHVEDDHLVLANVIFSDNWAPFGGGMYNGSGNPTLWNVTFQDNQAEGGGGGGMHNNSGSPTLINVIFRGNLASYGGGMSNFGGSPALTNVIFSGNVSQGGGGGMANFNASSPSLVNVTFTGNWASSGGGIFNTGSSNPLIQNSILWGNRGRVKDDQISNNMSSPAILFSDIEGSGGSGAGWDWGLGVDLGNNLDADPLFWDPIDPAGAPTESGNLRLRRGSPAIDVGDNSLLPPGLTTDLTGGPRIYNGIVDLGAYEAGQFFLIHLPVITKGIVP